MMGKPFKVRDKKTGKVLTIREKGKQSRDTNRGCRDPLTILAGTSPEELAQRGHWVASGIQQTGKDILSIPAHGINQFLGNLPRAALAQYQMAYPQAESLAGKVA